MGTCTKIIVAIAIVLTMVGIGGMICGSYGNNWYTSTFRFNSNTGLWQYCKKHGEELFCTDRKKVFKFSNDNFFFEVPSKTYDVVLILLIAAGGLGLISLIFMFLMCCLHGGTTWSVVSSCVSVLTFLSAGSSVAAVVYAELKIRREIVPSEVNLYEHGWSSILAWVGSGAFLIAFVMSLVMCCVKPRKKLSKTPYDTDTGFRYTPSKRPEYHTMSNINYDTSDRQNHNHTTFPGHDNTAYQLK